MKFSALMALTGLLVATVASLDVTAGPPSYPRVYGPTGSLYGPTQAHYQYQRRYGRPWHGSGGITSSKFYGNRSFFGGPRFGYSSVVGFGGLGYSFGVSRFGGFYGNGFYAAPYCPFPSVIQAPVIQQPVVSVVTTPVVVSNPVPVTVRVPQNNAVLAAALEENKKRWGNQIQIDQGIKLKKRHVKPSTAEAKLRSVRAETRGKVALRETDLPEAYFKFKDAIKHAGDRADPHFGLGFTLVAMKRYESAVISFKRGLELNKEWPQTADSLSEVYGEENKLAKGAHLDRVARWVKQDVRDPNRLFLMGLLLYVDDNLNQSTPFFEAALRLAGKGDHLLAFVEVEKEAEQKADPNAQQPAGIQLPLPEPATKK